MGSVAHLLLVISGIKSDYNKVLNIIGIGMLVPMPFLWIWDWIAIYSNIYTVINQAITHTIAQIWETTIQSICFVGIFKVKIFRAIIIAVLINAIYIGLAMHIIR